MATAPLPADDEPADEALREGGAPAFSPLPPDAPAVPDAKPPRWWGRHFAELRWQAEAARLTVDPVFVPIGLPRGDWRPVVLLPGFLAGDYTLAPMAGWLLRLGYRPSACGFLLNVGCSERSLQRIEQRVDALHRRTGRRVAVVGHSRGGHFARALAARRPDAVSHAISLGAALERWLDISVPTQAAVAVVRAAHRHTTDRAQRRGCLSEACTCAFAQAFAAPFPRSVRMTSIYSKGDGCVRWQSCIAPYAENVEVSGSHVGLAFNRKVYRAIAHALALPERPIPV